MSFSGNSDFGVGIGLLFKTQIGGTGTVVQGNLIGVDATGAIPLGSGLDGVFVEKDSLIYTIKEDLIAFNSRNGVNIPNVTGNPGNPGVQISIIDNSIWSNALLGIDLGDPGVTANDEKDFDAGANQQQNFPVLVSAAPNIFAISEERVSPDVTTTVIGTFNSTPNSTFSLQFFFGSICTASGHQFTGAIPIPLRPTVQVTTDSNGNAPFTFTFDFPPGFSAGFVNSTATDTLGNTSEISSCISVALPSAFLITSACKGDGKQLIISGSGFAEGAKVFLNGEQEKTLFVSSTQVIANKAGKRAVTGDTLKVRNPGGTETAVLNYTRVNCSP
jgi:hypothetical protein